MSLPQSTNRFDIINNNLKNNDSFNNPKNYDNKK